ncbi:hypothetical protein [Pikeienuella sp. HZG-20]|uniref:hypothetical protein n=1 Tax=Paludibacillus litoralis TaxID=3133267 RepID=UPI0030ECD70E
MDQTHRFTPHFTLPTWRAPDDARRELEARMEAFIAAAATGGVNPGQDSPVLTLKVSAGVGKTSTALRLLARHGRALLAKGHVLFYVPTLDLAERAAADLRKLDSSLPVVVIRGRRAEIPGSGIPMCQRADLVKQIAHLVPSVTEALCRWEEHGEPVNAPCAAGCPYLEQKDAVGAKIHFLSHNYLEAFPPLDRATDTALRIVDEKVWPTLVATTGISIDEIMSAPLCDFRQDLFILLSNVTSGIIHALRSGMDVRQHLRSLGVGSDKLEQLWKGERASRETLDIRPRHSRAEIESTLRTINQGALFASQKREALFKLLAEETPLGPNRLTIEEIREESGIRQIIRLHRVTQIPRDAPALLLDADADARIAERLAPGTSFTRIEAKPKAEIIQVSDRTLSNSWLLDPKRGTERRAKVRRIIEREVALAGVGRTLVVATKAVLEGLHGDSGPPPDDDEGDGSRRELLGATARWFGPRMLGVNDFERYRTIVIVGRLQPPVKYMERYARCLFSDEEDLLLRHQAGPLPKQASIRLMDDGSFPAAKVRAHPDPRVQAVLRQARECATLQAIARLRLISPDQAKRVVLLCDMPLLDLPITRLLSLDALYHDLPDEPDVPAYLRMERALQATMGRPVRGTRVSAAGLAMDLPRDFSSAAAKEFRRGRTSSDMLALIERIGSKNQWPTARVELIRQGCGGRPAPAIILAPESEALAQAGRLWPGLAARLIPQKNHPAGRENVFPPHRIEPTS